MKMIWSELINSHLYPKFFSEKNANKMSIICKTSMDEIERYIDEQINNLTSAIIRQLSYAGEVCVNTARGHHPNKWTDQTGNLKSSIGYVIAVGGEIVNMSDFPVVKEGKKGQEEGKNYAKELALQFPDDIALIVVAGMDYAYYVSKRKDVLDSAELKAEQIIPQLLKQLKLN